MGRSRYKIIHPDQPHFITLTVLHWIPVFTRPATVTILLDSLRFLQTQRLTIYAWVVLENHMHLVAQSPDLGKSIGHYKSFTARRLIDYLKQHRVKRIIDQLSFYKKQHKHGAEYQFWEEGIHPQLIINDLMMTQKVDYIHENPVTRGYVDKPSHWRYSSARDYAQNCTGHPSLLEVCKDW